jgi:hypothetical protein
MSNVPSRDYIDRRTAQLEAAVEARDGALAVAVMELIRADGYPEFAERWTQGLVGQGLQNLAAKAGVR